MTLPQYLDPFVSDTGDSGSIQPDSIDKVAIRLAVKYGRLPYTKLQGRLILPLTVGL